MPLGMWLKGRIKVIYLLAISYLFYGYWDWRFLSLIAFSTIVDYFVGQFLSKAKTKKVKFRWLLISVGVNLGLLGFFKYCNFFVDSFQDLVAQFGGNVDSLHLNIILPVGISFYTFQTMSYTIDIYRGKLAPTRDFLKFSLFVSFFPQLVAGPIERARDLLPQMAFKNRATRTQLKEGIVLITLGLFKKVMLGDTTGRIVDHIFAEPGIYMSDELIYGLILFSVQIYADFSGYSNIARGTAKLLGVELVENFNQPYFSKNITEFWRRWHISLSSWLKDYLYIPLGGNRNGKFKAYRNLMLTMLLGGLWHGANWTFIIWGALHGAYLIVHKLITKNKTGSDTESGNLLSLLKIATTFCLVLFAWLFFRAKSFDQAIFILNKIARFEISDVWGTMLSITLTFALVTVLLDYIEWKTKSHSFLTKIKAPGVFWGVNASLLIMVMLYMFQAEPLPFVYFQF